MEDIKITYCSDCIHHSEFGCNGKQLSKENSNENMICKRKISKVIAGEQTWIYKASDDDKNRYILGIIGNRPLICFGINPSTARPGNTDPTIRSVSRIAQYNGYDSWIMLNIYPQRATNPNHIDTTINPELLDENLYYINEIIQLCKPEELWAAWGNLINKRDFLMNCFTEISKLVLQHQCHWIRFGGTNKSGHPRHPLFLRTDSIKYDFNHC